MRDDEALGDFVHRPSLPDVERAVRSSLPVLGTLLDVVPWPILRRMALGVERVVSPGFVAHYALRKELVRVELLAAVADGFEQVVLLGAGFDMLASSLPERARVFEVDHPGTQRHRAVACSTERVVLVPVDLTSDGLLAALRAAPGYDPHADTVFVAEGLVMYLPGPRVEALLADMGRRHGGRTRVIASVVTPDASGRVRLHSQHRVVDLCMRLLGEPFVWGEPVDELTARLERHDLFVDRVASPDLVDGRLGRRMPRVTGELVVVASSSLHVDRRDALGALVLAAHGVA